MRGWDFGGSAVACATCVARTVTSGRAGLRARDRAAQLRIVVENGEQSCEAHDVLVIAVRPSSWLPRDPGGTVPG